MKVLALLGIGLVIGTLILAARYLLRDEHHDRSSGTDQFSPSDPAKADPGPNPP